MSSSTSARSCSSNLTCMLSKITIHSHDRASSQHEQYLRLPELPAPLWKPRSFPGWMGKALVTAALQERSTFRLASLACSDPREHVSCRELACQLECLAAQDVKRAGRAL